MRSVSIDKYAYRIDSNNLNKEELRKIAKNVNNSRFHCSGNCVLLSRCLYFNLLNGKTFMSAGNTYPFYRPVDANICEHLIFGGSLPVIYSRLNNVEKLEESLIKTYKEMGCKHFIVGFSPLLPNSSGHSFNAVILLDEAQKPYVQFVDAWKTSNPLPSKQDLVSRYTNGYFDVQISDRE